MPKVRYIKLSLEDYTSIVADLARIQAAAETAERTVNEVVVRAQRNEVRAILAEEELALVRQDRAIVESERIALADAFRSSLVGLGMSSTTAAYYVQEVIDNAGV